MGALKGSEGDGEVCEGVADGVGWNGGTGGKGEQGAPARFAGDQPRHIGCKAPHQHGLHAAQRDLPGSRKVGLPFIKEVAEAIVFAHKAAGYFGG